MDQNLLSRAAKFLREHRLHKKWQKVVTCLAAVVVFCTTYALILPAITMETTTICGLEAHTHTEACYTTTTELTCDLGESDEHTHTDACYTTTTTLTCGKEEHVHTVACYPDPEEETVAEESNAAAALSLDDGEEEAENADQSDNGKTADANENQNENENQDTGDTNETQSGPANMTGNVTKVTGTGTTYDPGTDNYKTSLKIEFEFNRSDIISNNYTYQMDLPEGIIVPEELLDGSYKLKDSSDQEGGTYQFVKKVVTNENGTTTTTYTMLVTFDKTYVSNAGDTITGYVQFNGQIGGDQQESDGSINIEFRDGLTLTIPPNEIKYSDSETRNYDIDVSKSGSYVSDDGTLHYTVNIYSIKGTDKITLTDVMTATGLNLGDPTNITIATGTVPCYRNNNGTTTFFPANAKWNSSTLLDEDAYSYRDGTLTMTLDPLAAGTEGESDTSGVNYTCNCYQITYEYSLSDLQEGTTNIDNTVTVRSEDTSTKEIVTDTANAQVYITIDKSNTIDKSGYYDADARKIHWTITVNKNKVNIAGALLTDEMFDQLTSTDLSITPGNDYQLQTDENGKVTGIQFTGTAEDGTNTNQYTITYSTAAEVGTTISNTATFDPDTSFSGDEIEGTTSVTTGGVNWVAKDFSQVAIDEQKIATVTWSVTIDATNNTLPAGTVITDEAREYSNDLDNFYMTKNQVIAFIQAFGLNTDGLDTTFSLSCDDVSYNSISDLAADGKFSLVSITLLKPLTLTNTTFTYDTTVDLSQVNSDTYYDNYIYVGDKQNDANYTYYYYQGGAVKTDGNGQTGSTTATNEDGTLTWKVTTTIGTEDGTFTSLNVTDTLPENIALESLSVQDNDSWAIIDLTIDPDTSAISGSNSTYTVSGTYANNVVTLNITLSDGATPPGAGSTITVTYNCKVRDSILTEAGTEKANGTIKTYTFTNKATVKLNDDKTYTPEHTQSWQLPDDSVPVEEMKVLKKGGVWDKNAQELQYSVEINPEGKDLIAEADTLTLKDVLTYSPQPNDYKRVISLIQSSVKLYYAQVDENGNAVLDENGKLIKDKPVTDWSWTYETVVNGDFDAKNTLIATIPDSTPLILEYDYSVVIGDKNPFGDDKNAVDSDLKLQASNSVTLEGTSEYAENDQKDTKWEASETSGGLTTDKSYLFYKVEQGNYNKALPGAVFTVYKYNAATGKCDQSVKTYTTNNYGTFTITREENGADVYDYNTLYMVVETQAPTGYKLPDDPAEYYFYFSSDTDTEHTLPDSLPAGAVNLSTTSSTAYVENVNNMTSITVNKQWFEADKETEITNKAGTISFDLYQIASTTPPGNGSGSGGSESGGGETGEGSGESGSGTAELTFSVQGTLTDDNNRLSQPYSKAAGTTVTLVIKDCYGNKYQPTVSLNDVALVAAVSDGTEWNPGWGTYTPKIYTYTFDLVAGSNSLSISGISWNAGDWELVSLEFTDPTTPTDPDPTDPGDEGENGGDPAPTTPAGTKIGDSYTISKDSGWTWTKSDLPLTGEDDDGNTVYYTYYVVEHPETNYTTEYDGNDQVNGIQSGKITIKNIKNDTPTYELPETGGIGATPYTMGGLLLSAGAAFLLYKNIRRRKEDK